MAKEYIRPVTLLGQIPFANRVVLSDDFESLLHWSHDGTGGDYVLELDPSLSKHGNQSLYMKTRTTLHAEDDTVGARRNVHLLPTKVLTLLCNFLIPDGTKTKAMEYTFDWYDGTLIHNAAIIYTLADHQWKYYGSGEAYVNIPDANVPLQDGTFHLLKLDINLGNDTYISLQIDHMIYDLSALSLFSESNEGGSRLVATAIAHASADDPGSLNIDDLAIYEV